LEEVSAATYSLVQAAWKFNNDQLPLIDIIHKLAIQICEWLPAKSKISSAFLMFYARTPEGFRKVDDVVLEGGRLTVEDRASGKKLILAASRGL
jgi:hypothetical protein